MSDESWKPIPGYVGEYEASTWGRIRRICEFGTKSRKPPYILKPQNHPQGYWLVALHKGAINGVRQQKMQLIHRLVAAAFHGESCLTVNHKNFNKHDNRPENLEYMTLVENSNHSVENGRNTKGESVGNHKLTAEQVIEIRRLKKDGVHYKEIAAKYGIHPMNVYQVINYTWRHII